VSPQAPSSQPGGDIRKGLSSSQCIASTGKTFVVATLEIEARTSAAPAEGGEGAQLPVQVMSSSTAEPRNDTHGEDHSVRRDLLCQIRNCGISLGGCNGQCKLTVGNQVEGPREAVREGGECPLEWVVGREEGREVNQRACGVLQL
jgi:hypothetical protein